MISGVGASIRIEADQYFSRFIRFPTVYDRNQWVFEVSLILGSDNLELFVV